MPFIMTNKGNLDETTYNTGLDADTLTLGNIIVSGGSNMYGIVNWDTDVGPLRMVITAVDVNLGYSAIHGASAARSKPTIDLNSLYRGPSRLIYLTTPVWESYVFGTSKLTNGVSQYVPGTFSVPTQRTRHVGSGQEFATVYDAYIAAINGDNIIIHPGTHNCNQFGAQKVEKDVRFYGSTENPADVILSASVSSAQYFEFFPNRAGVVGPSQGMFHMTLSRNVFSWRHTITQYANF